MSDELWSTDMLDPTEGERSEGEVSEGERSTLQSSTNSFRQRLISQAS